MDPRYELQRARCHVITEVSLVGRRGFKENSPSAKSSRNNPTHEVRATKIYAPPGFRQEIQVLILDLDIRVALPVVIVL